MFRSVLCAATLLGILTFPAHSARAELGDALNLATDCKDVCPLGITINCLNDEDFAETCGDSPLQYGCTSSTTDCETNLRLSGCASIPGVLASQAQVTLNPATLPKILNYCDEPGTRLGTAIHELAHVCDPRRNLIPRFRTKLELCLLEERAFTFGADCGKEAVLTACASQPPTQACFQECLNYVPNHALRSAAFRAFCPTGPDLSINLGCSETAIAACEEWLNNDPGFKTCIKAYPKNPSAHTYCTQGCDDYYHDPYPVLFGPSSDGGGEPVSPLGE